MTRSYDDALVDYSSAAFHVGFEEGHASLPRQDEPGDPETSDEEWASYCEGWLMGASVLLWAREIPPEHGLSEEQQIAENVGLDDVFIRETRYKRLESTAAEAKSDPGRKSDRSDTGRDCCSVVALIHDITLTDRFERP